MIVSSFWLKRRVKNPSSFIVSVASSTRRFVARAISTTIHYTLTLSSAVYRLLAEWSQKFGVLQSSHLQTWSFSALSITMIPLFWISPHFLRFEVIPFPRSILSQVMQITYDSNAFRFWRVERTQL